MTRPGLGPVGTAALRDGSAVSAADGAGLLPAAGCAGAQVRVVAGQLERWAGLERPRSLVVVGADADLAVALVAALAPARTAGPLLAAEAVPAWVGPLALVVVLAGRRDDHAAAAAADLARRRGAAVLVRGAVDGPVAAAAGAALLPAEVAVPEALAGPTRFALVAGVAAAAGLIPDQQLSAVADLLDVTALTLHPSADPFANRAVDLTEQLAGSVPVLIGADAVGDAVAGYGARLFAQLAGVPATALTAATAAASPVLFGRIAAGRDLFADPDDDEAGIPPTRPVLITAGGTESGQRLLTALRSALPTAAVVEADVESTSALGRALLATTQLDFTAVYLGLVLGQLIPPDHPDGLGRGGGARWAVRAATVDPDGTRKRSDTWN